MVGETAWREVTSDSTSARQSKLAISLAGPGPQDGPPSSAGDVAAVRPGAQPATLLAVRGASAGPGAAGAVLGPDPVPGAAPAGQYAGSYETVKRFVQPLRTAAAAAAGTQTAVRERPGAAEPDRLGAGPGAFRPRRRARRALLRADPGLLAPQLLRGLPGRDARPVPRRPRAGLRALRRPHPRASVRSAAHGLSSRRRRGGCGGT